MLDTLPWSARLVLCSLAVWRLTHLVVAEDGPFGLIVRLRSRLGDTPMGRSMDCFYCASFWLALPLTLVMTRDVPCGLLSWLAIAGGAALLEQATNPTLERN